MADEKKSSYSPDIHRFYCINLPRCKKRRERMEHRFAYHKLSNYVTYIDAIDYNDPTIDEYGEGFEKDGGPLKEENRKITACLISHLKAIRTYVEDLTATNTRGAIICEDDILLHNDWAKLQAEVMGNAPAETKGVMFCYMLDEWEGTTWIGDPKKQNLFRSANKLSYPFGTQMYWISREFAPEALKQLDHKMVYLQQTVSTNVTSELVTYISNAILTYPCLAIEDCIDSIIHPDHMDWHIDIFADCGFTRYDQCMKDSSLSPLAEGKEVKSDQITDSPNN